MGAGHKVVRTLQNNPFKCFKSLAALILTGENIKTCNHARTPRSEHRSGCLVRVVVLSNVLGYGMPIDFSAMCRKAECSDTC